jgi:hypothetical protein
VGAYVNLNWERDGSDWQRITGCCPAENGGLSRIMNSREILYARERQPKLWEMKRLKSVKLGDLLLGQTQRACHEYVASWRWQRRAEGTG